MGLDMYINQRASDSSRDTEEAYWRKERDLHQLFNDLADKKGIEYTSFNCIEVPLTSEDLTYITNRLHEIDLQDPSHTIEQLAHCKFLVGTGADLYYDSWW